MNVIDKTYFKEELINLLQKEGSTKKFRSGKEITPTDDIHDQVIFLIQGSIKVFIKNDDKKIFLYLLEDNQTHFFYSPNKDILMQFQGEIVKDCILTCIPCEILVKWVEKKPQLRDFMIAYQQEKYIFLLNTIKMLIEQPLKMRLLEYITLKSIQYNNKNIHINKNEIAIDLNTSRKSIYRAINELERDKKIIQKPRSIVLLI